MSASLGTRTRVPARARLSTRPSTSSRRSASVTGSTLIPSSRASLRRDRGVPGRSWPLRISSRIAAYARSDRLTGAAAPVPRRLKRSGTNRREDVDGTLDCGVWRMYRSLKFQYRPFCRRGKRPDGPGEIV